MEGVIIKKDMKTLINETSFSFELNDLGTGYIITYARNRNATTIIIPEKHNNLPVTEIQENAFMFSKLKKIIIPNTICRIRAFAFNECRQLEEITIPHNVKTIERGTFFGCESLKKVTIPEGVSKIENYAFFRCASLENILISKNVTNIGICSFAGCTNLESIVVDEENPVFDSRDNCNAIIDTKSNSLLWGSHNTIIPRSIKSIGDNAFDGCEKLKYLTIHKDIVEIGEYSFAGCINLESIVVDEENPVFDSRDNCNAIIDTKSNSLLWGCHNTIIPRSITSIGDHAFDGCEKLKYLTIHKDIVKIGEYSFVCCPNLESIVVDEENPVFDSRDNCNAIIDTKSNSLLCGCHNTKILPSVKCIKEYAFAKCKLKSIIIPEGVTTIETSAFINCDSLESIVILSSLVNIEDCAFCGCENIKRIFYYDENTEFNNKGFSESILGTVDFYFYKEKKPNRKGYYWHYDGDGNIVIW